MNNKLCGKSISTHALRGERDEAKNKLNEEYLDISTHALRGERDLISEHNFQTMSISTHALRGERDLSGSKKAYTDAHFNSRAPWGA